MELNGCHQNLEVWKKEQESSTPPLAMIKINDYTHYYYFHSIIMITVNFIIRIIIINLTFGLKYAIMGLPELLT